MVSILRGLGLAACFSVGYMISADSGLDARAAEPTRWFQSVAADALQGKPEKSTTQLRIAELEQRVQELEAQLLARPEGCATSGAEGVAEAGMRPCDPLPLVGQRPPESCNAHAETLEDDPRERLRHLATAIRNGETSYRRLSPEWNAAINVLVRRERPLDPTNPWDETP